VNSRRIIHAFIIALVISATCTYLLNRRISRRAAQNAHRSLNYVAPAKDLSVGELLKADDVKIVDWPVDNALTGAFSHPEDVVGRVLLYPIGLGQPLTDKYLSAAGAGAGLAAKIPDGMRAIALRSDEIVGVAGFLLPGSHLDVLVTYHTDKSPEPMTSTVLQNAEVIAAGHQVTPDPEGKPATATVVTLLLTPFTLYFGMRPTKDGQKIHPRCFLNCPALRQPLRHLRPRRFITSRTSRRRRTRSRQFLEIRYRSAP
jgi:pilus assembly protein CpaB